MGKSVTVKQTASYFIDKVIKTHGGVDSLAAMSPKELRALIRKSFCLQEACKCSEEICVCTTWDMQVGEKYRRRIWNRVFKERLRTSKHAHTNSLLAVADII